MLENARVTNIEGLTSRAPNFKVVRQPSSAALAQYNLRGIQGGDTQSQIDSGVGIYIDGVYLGRASSSLFDIADIDRVEVLRGPQGTLFGRNTTGGAVNFVTRTPPGRFGIRQDLTAGNFGEFRSRTRIDLPAMGAFTASVSYLHRKVDGWVRNLNPGVTHDLTATSLGRIGRIESGSTLGAEKSDSVFAAIHYDSEGPLTADYRFDYTDFRGTQDAFQTFGFRTETDPGINPLGGIAQFIYSLQPRLGGTSVVSAKPLDAVAAPSLGTDRMKIAGHSLTLSYKLTDAMTLKNIAAYRSSDALNTGNSFEGNYLIDPFGGTGHQFTILNAFSTRRQHQVSDELQLFGDTDKLRWVTGAFFFEENANDYNPVPFFTTYPANGILTLKPADIFADVQLKQGSFATFGQLTWHATDRLDLTAGVRQTWDKREELNFRPDLVAQAGGVPPTTKVNFDKLTWQANADFNLTRRIMLYGKVGTGYLSGGVYNTVPFKPESIISYELGLKSELFDRRLRLNLAAFDAEYKDLQVFYFTSRVFYENAGKARIKGLELEATAVPFDRLTLNGSVGLLDFNYEKYVSAIGGVPTDIANVARRQNTPKGTFSGGVQYDTREISAGAYLSFAVDAQWRDDVKFVVLPISDPALDEAATSKAAWTVNARASLVNVPVSAGKVRVSVFGQNLFDTRRPEYVADISGLISGSFNRPRTYGLELTAEF
jgi:iron complex outermembrane receptor protein